MKNRAGTSEMIEADKNRKETMPMSRINKSLLTVAIFILVIPVLYLGGFLFICPWINNAKAERIEKAYQTFQLPPQTELVETTHFCGNTTGTGNHVEIWSGALLKSELSKEELANWLAKNPLPREASNPILWQVGEQLDARYPESLSFIQFKHLEDFFDSEGHYIVGGYYDAVTQNDIRGH
ncbi:hypothetical protein NRIC_05520 [Enterococcus florum]|uniref:Uncharacterized protein n=1 Tax=Enterococcus florum TaxID=2480627 RepID=A0A4P5P8W3_9ENTE|nr:hypothetical protein [Enterococcus florum]GCF92661.1 hypothetical protein NRIC_05520 [Enterococcus florum]